MAEEKAEKRARGLSHFRCFLFYLIIDLNYRQGSQLLPLEILGISGPCYGLLGDVEGSPVCQELMQES